MNSDQDTKKISSHIGRFGFDLYENETKIVSAGQDCMFKVYDIQNDQLEMIKQLNCEDAYSLSVQQTTNDIYLSYFESKNVIKASDIEYLNEIIGEEVASFTGPIYQIQIGGDNNFIALSTSENKCYLMQIKENGDFVKKYLNDNHVGSCLFSTVDQESKYALTVGVDGNIKIFNIENFENRDPIFETALQVANTMSVEKEFVMECSFNNKNQIAVGGNASLQLIERDSNGRWILNRIPEINHKREIQLCQFIEDGKYLITAGTEREVKIWDFEEKVLLGQFSCEETICTIRYSKINKSIFVGDSEGILYRFSDLDFERMYKKALQQKQTNQPKIQQKKESITNKYDIEDNKKKMNSAEKIAPPISAKKEEISKSNKKFDQFEEESSNQEIQTTITKAKVYEQKTDSKPQKKNNLDGFLNKIVDIKTLKETPAPQEKVSKVGSIETPTKEMNDLNINRVDKELLKKFKKIYKIHDIIYPSSIPKQMNRSCLIWNLVGQILLREEDKDLFLDFDFADKEMYQKITLKNLHNYQMAAMNKQGFILASKAISSSQEYEGEEETERFDFHQDAYDYSFIYFQSFSKSYKNTWSLKLSKDENAETVAIGDGWCAVQTNLYYIRIYSFSSMEQHCLCIDKPVVCISGYKNLLAVVYLEGEPVCGCQSIKLKFFDSNSGEVLKEVGVPITPFTTLQWFGFSEEGLVLTKDSKGIIRALVGFSTWTPIYDQPSNKNFWLKGMIDYTIIGFLLPKDEFEPRLTQIQNEKCVEMALPLPTGDFFENIEEYKVLRHKQLILKHEKFRYQNIEQNEQTEQEITKIQKEIDTKTLKIFQKCLASGEYQRGFQVVKSNIINPTYIDACILIAQKAKQSHLEQSLLQLLQQKINFHQKQKDKQSQSSLTNSNVQSQMKPSQNIIILSKATASSTQQRGKRLLLEKKQDEYDSSDDEDKKIQEQENVPKNSTKPTGNDIQNAAVEKKGIGNNPFQKQSTKSSIQNEDIQPFGKQKKNEEIISLSKNRDKKLKF